MCSIGPREETTTDSSVRPQADATKINHIVAMACSHIIIIQPPNTSKCIGSRSIFPLIESALYGLVLEPEKGLPAPAKSLI
jgi:hypothetical protein